MAKVVRLDARSEHVNIETGDGNVHVIPIAVFRYIVAGKLTVNKVSDFIPIYREITRQWMHCKGLL